MTNLSTLTRHLSALVLAALVLSACSAPAPEAPTPDASPTPSCNLPATVGEDPELASAIEEALAQRFIRATRVVATVNSINCPGAWQATITRIDFALDITVDDITAPVTIGNATYWSIRAMDELAQLAPGDVHIIFESAGQIDSLAFKREDGSRAIGSGDVGIDLLASLGYAPVLPAGDKCIEMWARQPLPALSRLAREAFDREGLSKLAVSASVIGRRCGDAFTPVQTELQAIVGDPSGGKSTSGKEIGNATAKIFDALLSLPRAEMQGDASPRIVVIEGWKIRRTLVITMDEAEALQAQGLSGNAMFIAAGYR